MMKPFIALAAAAALPHAASAGTEASGNWNLTSEGNACMATSAAGDGTVLSILAQPTDGAFVFLVQNPAWQSLEDGGRYALAVEFDDFGPWQVEASARQEIDSDGPGLAFLVAPGRQDGNGFIQELIRAGRMEIAAGGQAVGSVSVGGSEGAMQGLAHCLADRWAGLDPEDTGGEAEAIQAASETPATPL